MQIQGGFNLFLQKIVTCILIVIILLPQVACSIGNDGSEYKLDSQSSSQMVDFPVDIGDIRIHGAPKAVVSLSPATTELLFEMGYEKRVIGVSNHCDAPTQVVNKARCGTVFQPNFSAIAQRPVDLVIASAGLAENHLTLFQQAGIPVLILARGETLEAVRQNYLTLALVMDGNLTGADIGERYWAQQKALLETTENLGKEYHSRHDTPLRAILLREIHYSMATGDTFEQQLLDMLGLHNEAQPYQKWLYPREKVAALEPDIIFAACNIDPKEIIDSVVYAPVAAVKNRKIMNIDLVAFERQSPRMFQILLEMAHFAYDVAQL